MDCVCCFGYEGIVLPFTDEYWSEVVAASNQWTNFNRPPKMVNINIGYNISSNSFKFMDIDLPGFGQSKVWIS